MPTKEELEQIADQLVSLDIMYLHVGNTLELKLTDKFMNAFFRENEEHYYDIRGNFEHKVYVLSIMALSTLHPELTQKELRKLGVACNTILQDSYGMTEEKYQEFKSLKKANARKS